MTFGQKIEQLSIDELQVLIDRAPQSSLLDACAELGIDKSAMDARWGWAYGEDGAKPENVFSILTGRRVPAEYSKDGSFVPEFIDSEGEGIKL